MSDESKTPLSDYFLTAGNSIAVKNASDPAAVDAVRLQLAYLEQLKRIADALQARAEGAAIDAFLEGFTAGDEKESLAAALNKWHEERYGK